MYYSSLFLDLDNTLLDFSKAEEAAIEIVLKKYSLPSDIATIRLYSNINKSYWESFERGEIPKSAIFEGRFNSLFSELGVERDAAVISKDYCLNLSEQYFTVEGAIEILTYLKNRGYKLYATTNGLSLTQFKRIKNSGLEPFFDGVFVSETVNHQKPEKEYFEYVMNNIPENDKSKVLIIGDSQSSDILGGINSNIDTCWYNPNKSSAEYQSKFEINLLSELKNIL